MNKKEINERIEDMLKKYSNSDDAWIIGYKKFGPFLFGLCNWLKNEFEANDIKNIYFLARDGFIIKKAFELMYGSSDKYHYLYLSRRSLALPAMKCCSSIVDILDYLVLPPAFKIDELLKALQLYSFESDILEENFIDKNEIFYRKTFKTDQRLINIIKKYEKEINNNINNQSNLFLKYLEQERFNDDVAIIDIGWHNSIQFLINAVFKNNYSNSIYGYYVGVYNDSKTLPLNNKVNGYLYNGSVKKDNLMYKTFAFVSLLESLFLAQEGSTLLYTEESNKIVPILNKYEYDGKSEMYGIIKQIQEGALQFCNDFKDDDLLKAGMTKKMAFENLLKLGIHPSKKELSILSKLEFENFTNSNIINYNHNTFYYLTHLKEMKEDFYKSGWRIAFLKKLIPIPFPHYTFFKLLCKIFL